jgi:hypothetical protein
VSLESESGLGPRARSRPSISSSISALDLEFDVDRRATAGSGRTTGFRDVPIRAGDSGLLPACRGGRAGIAAARPAFHDVTRRQRGPCQLQPLLLRGSVHHGECIFVQPAKVDPGDVLQVVRLAALLVPGSIGRDRAKRDRALGYDDDPTDVEDVRL